MDRREFLNLAGAAAFAAAVPEFTTKVSAAGLSAPPADAPWRTFEVVTDVEIRPLDVPVKLWLPLPLYRDTKYQRTRDIRWAGNPAKTGIYRDPKKIRRPSLLRAVGRSLCGSQTASYKPHHDTQSERGSDAVGRMQLRSARRARSLPASDPVHSARRGKDAGHHRPRPAWGTEHGGCARRMRISGADGRGGGSAGGSESGRHPRRHR